MSEKAAIKFLLKTLPKLTEADRVVSDVPNRAYQFKFDKTIVEVVFAEDEETGIQGFTFITYTNSLPRTIIHSHEKDKGRNGPLWIPAMRQWMKENV